VAIVGIDLSQLVLADGLGAEPVVVMGRITPTIKAIQPLCALAEPETGCATSDRDSDLSAAAGPERTAEVAARNSRLKKSLAPLPTLELLRR
jgi:hypothetical protein